jgi:hypothetical protein
MLPTDLEAAYGVKEIEHRLLSKRDIDPVSGCWNWSGAEITSRYGVIRLRRGGGSGQYLVHRLAAMIWLNLDPDSAAHVCHRCDNRKCFRPDHLFVGDNRANVRDAVSKGHHRFEAHHGESNGRSKLTAATVQAARVAHAAGEPIKTLAETAGVTYSAMWQAIRGLTWRCV